MPTHYSKLRLLAAMVPAVLALLCSPARASDFPSRPIRFIVPFSAGGQLDYVARLIAKPMSRELGQSVIVENDSGAGGTVAGAKVAIAAPDGYTLLEYGENFPIAKHLIPHLSYDPVHAFAMVSGISLSPHIILVARQLPVHNLRELAAYGKAHPGALSYGSPGLGSSMNLTFEMIKRHFGIDAVHVPYRGGANMLTDLAGGQINVGVIAVSPAMPLIKSGKVRAIAITSATRDAVLPDVPTVAESGYPGYTSGSWAGVAVPKGTPPAVISRLNQAVLAALADPRVKQALAAQSFTAIGGTPEQLTQRVRRDSDRYGPLIRKLGLRVN